MWDLPNGAKIEFYHEPSVFFQSDHSKCIDLIKSDGTKSHYEFAQAHSGYNNVDLRINKENSIISIVDLDQKRVGMSLSLAANEFKNENETQPIGVDVTSGRSLPKHEYK